MKRLSAILLALIYITTTSGVVINTHYCMGKVAEVAIGASGKAKCGTCGMENQGCCHDDLQVFKIRDNHNFSSANVDIPTLESLAPKQVEQQYSVVPVGLSITGPANHSPPISVPIHILFCVYRI